MASYVIRRLLISIPLLIGVTFITFMVMQLAPGDMLSPYRNDPLISKDTLRRIEAKYRLDKPLVVQYLIWLNDLSPFGFRAPKPPAAARPASRPASGPTATAPAPKPDSYFWRTRPDGSRRLNWPRPKWPDMGESFTQKKRVTEVIKGRAVNTIILSVSSMLFAWMVALPLGILAAVKQNKLTDRLAAFVAFMGMSMPGFFLCLLLLYAASFTGMLPVGGMTSPTFEQLSAPAKVLDVAWHLLIPMFVIGFGSVAGLQRIMRGNMLEVLRMQYITTARAKGLDERKVIYRHAQRNAINPMLTIFGYQLSSVLSGAALTEIVISWPGLGMLMLEAVRAQDIFLVMGNLLIGGILLIAGNLIADILLALADPRISYE